MITYDLSNGLMLHKEEFSGDCENTEHLILGSEFTPLAKNSIYNQQASLARSKPLIQNKDGRRLIAIQLNPSADDAVLFGMSWGANFEHYIGESMVACVASKFEDRKIVSWNAFGRGTVNLSSLLPKIATKHASNTGSYDLIGKEYAIRLSPLITGSGQIDLIGASEGGRIVLAMARHLGKTVRNIVMLDSPGTLGTSYPKYVGRFLSERTHSNTYVEHTMDTMIKNFVPEHQNIFKRSNAIWKDISNGDLLDHYYRAPKAMGKNGLLTDLLLAAPCVTGKIAYILPEFTKLNDPSRVRDDMAEVAKQFPKISSEVWSFPGTHAIINAGNMVEAVLLAYALKN